MLQKKIVVLNTFLKTLLALNAQEATSNITLNNSLSN
jgi:hypothetical protein